MAKKEEMTEKVEEVTVQEEKAGKKKSGTKKRSSSASLKKELETMKGELEQMQDKFLRLYAEFDNYKKRTVREKLELRNTAAQDTLSSLLPVLDDFDRAKKTAEDESTDESFSEGVSMVYNKLYATLTNLGLQAMETDGEDFDPEKHEAISEVPAPSEEMKGKILDTIEKGYYLHDKIIRYAKVVVGK